MARKKRNTTTYLVMVHDDGSPAEVLLPDGRMALLLPSGDMCAATTAIVTNGVIRRHRNRITVELDTEPNIEWARDEIRIDEGPAVAARARLEVHPMVCFD